MVRLTDEEITGTETSAGIIEKYFSLSQEDTTSLQDITLGAGEMKVGDNLLCLHTLSETEDLPSSVGTDSRYERLLKLRICRHPWVRTAVMNGCPRTAATAACPLPHR